MSVDEWTFGENIQHRASERAIIRETGNAGLDDLYKTAKANGWDEILYSVREEMQRRVAERYNEEQDR